jgi:hypothetical protein
MDRAPILNQTDDDQLGQLGVSIGLEILNRRGLAQPVCHGIHDPFSHGAGMKEARFMAGDPQRYRSPGVEMALPGQPFGPAPEVRKSVGVECAQLKQYPACGSKV